MQDFVFRNKWVLLATAILLLVGVSWLIGREDDQGMLAQTQSEAQDIQQPAQSAPANVVPPSPAATEDESASDDDADSDTDDSDLIETPEGYDPSPPDAQSSQAAHQGGDPPPSEVEAGNDNSDGSD